MSRMAITGVAVLLAASGAFAGTAMFDGALGDVDAQLEGGWVDYLPTGIDSVCTDGCDTDYTTNLTSLCGGPKTLAEFGTFTIKLKEPLWNWTTWWGSWLWVELSDGVDVVATLGINPPFTWSSYPNEWISGDVGTDHLTWTGADCGVPTECWDAVLVSMDDWDSCLDGYRPIGLRISSDGTNVSFQVTTNGWSWATLPGASWTIASMPGGLGDMSAVDLSLEIGANSNISEIDAIEWTAASVPNLNQDPVPGCVGGPVATYGSMFDDFTISYYPTFNHADLSGPDHNWDGMADPYQLALAAAAICDDPAIAAVYEDNVAVALNLIATDYWGWGEEPLSWATQIAAEALWDDGKGAINWYFWIFDPDASNLQSVPELTAAGDYDGDGWSNSEEYTYVIGQGGSPDDFVYAAMGGIAGPGLPVAGLVGLALLAGAGAFGGVLALRRRK